MKIYCDMDGVLTDFKKGLWRLGAEKDSPVKMWRKIGQAQSFYRNLPWTSDGRVLWNKIRYLDTSILTGVSCTPKASVCAEEKAAWCAEHLTEGSSDLIYLETSPLRTNHVRKARDGSRIHCVVEGTHSSEEGTINVITCWSKNKHFESGRGRILIDDDAKHRDKWEEGGGVFIHHRNATSTLAALKDLGVLDWNTATKKGKKRRLV